MTQTQPDPEAPTASAQTDLDIGGLRFEVSFRGEAGATIRVCGHAGDDNWTEMLRFDDFIESPHYHVPASAKPFMFDRENMGAPLPWYISQIRDNLAPLLTQAGFESVLPDVDLAAVSAGADRIEQAMEDCVPEGFARVPGIGIQPV